jgi:hypothetical protein
VGVDLLSTQRERMQRGTPVFSAAATAHSGTACTLLLTSTLPLQEQQKHCVQRVTRCWAAASLRVQMSLQCSVLLVAVCATWMVHGLPIVMHSGSTLKLIASCLPVGGKFHSRVSTTAQSRLSPVYKGCLAMPVSASMLGKVSCTNAPSVPHTGC